MEKDVGGVTKDVCHVKKLPWNAVLGAFMGAWENPEPIVGAGFEGFGGRRAEGASRFILVRRDDYPVWVYPVTHTTRCPVGFHAKALMATADEFGESRA